MKTLQNIKAYTEQSYFEKSQIPQVLPPASAAPPPSACSTATTPTTTTTTSSSPATKSDSGRRTDSSRPSPSRHRGSGRSTPRQRPLAASASTVRAGGSFRESIQCCREKLIDPGSLSLENSTRNVDECHGWVDGCSKEAKYFKGCISTTQLNQPPRKAASTPSPTCSTWARAASARSCSASGRAAASPSR